MEPSLRVVIPAYNAAGTIGETLRSLAVQEDRDFSVAVIDDHSTDDTISVAHAVILGYGLDGTVTQRPLDRPRGPAACRNAGMQGADWYVFLDADDLALPRRIAAIKRAIYEHPGVGLIHHPAVHRWPDGTERVIGTDSAPVLTQGNSLTCSAVAIRHGVGRFDERLVGVEDWALWLQIEHAHPIAFIREPLTIYRAGMDGLGLGHPLAHYERQASLLAASVRGALTWRERRQLSRTLTGWLGWHRSRAKQASPRGTLQHSS